MFRGTISTFSEGEAQSAIIRNSDRVRDLGEVFTPKHLIDAMLDLLPKREKVVQQDSCRYLDPACGDGRFLEAILERKIRRINRMKNRHLAEYDYRCLIALSTIHGIDIDLMNVAEARTRQYHAMLRLYKGRRRSAILSATDYILESVIVCQDFLSPAPFHLTEWTATGRGQFKRTIHDGVAVIRHNAELRHLAASDCQQALLTNAGIADTIIKELAPIHWQRLAS